MSELPLEMPTLPPSHGQVVLRPFTEADVPMLLDLSTDPYVPLIGTLPAHTDVPGAVAYIERQRAKVRNGAGYSFCAALASTGEAVGGAGLWLQQLEHGRATAGYAIAPAYRGRGLATDALRALTTFAWTVPGLHRVELYVEPWNVASCGVAGAAGFELEGLLRSHQEIGGSRVDMRLYAAVAPGDRPDLTPRRTPRGARR
ncbi:GNAT family N-acetyltransferase [Nocardioides sp.]|uniref:GNAT family N-acetyltransferase n=1 Tax=Nocardioides sp. TaxID=35761 RepID=UPI002735EE69|nr:GNAT family protein [Nocardioides sp.]MDP3894296.1 GNAT family protein [Nocardioides sp.]